MIRVPEFVDARQLGWQVVDVVGTDEFWLVEDQAMHVCEDNGAIERAASVHECIAKLRAQQVHEVSTSNDPAHDAQRTHCKRSEHYQIAAKPCCLARKLTARSGRSDMKRFSGLGTFRSAQT